MRDLIISGFLFFSVCALFGQRVDSTLYSAGFENILIREETDTTFVFFEHREFRDPYASMEYANLLLAEEDEKYVWIPQFHNVPIGEYSKEGLKFTSLSKENKEYYKAQNKPIRNYRFHFRLHPDIAARFGYYSNPFEVKFNMVLDTRIYLLPGLSLQTGISIPVVNSLDSQGMYLRPAPSMIHYMLSPLQNHYFAMSAGTFYYDRYGLDFQYRFYRPDGKISFGLESGLTGFYRFYRDGYRTTNLDRVYAVGDVEYKTGLENLSLRLSAGRFLFEDYGVSIDLIKQFGNVDLGLYASHTELGSTAGFQFAFQLFPGNIFRTKHIELRTTEAFRWEYSYNSFEPAAKKFRIGMERLADALRQF